MRVTAVIAGIVFGFLLAWIGFADPDAIRRMLLLVEPYLFLVFFSAVAVAFVGARLVRRAGVRAPITGERVDWSTAPPARRHVGGSVLFGAGWAISSSCPGPIAVQLGQGLMWSLFTIGGILLGLVLFTHRDSVQNLIRTRKMAEQLQGR